MQLKLRKEFSVGLAKSDLSLTVPKFGTGANLILEFQITTNAEHSENAKEFWAKRLGEVVSGLDHVHLNLDHAELKGQVLTEQKLLNWVVEKLQKDAVQTHFPLKKVSLITAQNLEFSIAL